MQNIDSKLRLAHNLLQQGRSADAETAYREILDEDPEHAAANLAVGRLLQSRQLHRQSLYYLERAVTSDLENGEAHFVLANILRALNRIDDAAEHFRESIRLDFRAAAAHGQLGKLYQILNRFKEAEMSLLKALELRPDYPDALSDLGKLYADQGKIQEAVDKFSQAIALKPDHYIAILNLAIFREYRTHDREVDAMERLFAQPDANDLQKSYLGFALGKAFEDLEDYPRSFRYLQEGNAAQRRLHPYSVNEDVRTMSRIKAATEIDNFKFDNREKSDVTPIFIVSMPRAGSTLTEQILASHSEVTAGGELPILPHLIRNSNYSFPEDFARLDEEARKKLREEYYSELRKVSDGKQYVTDKFPLNFLHVGVIRLLMPDARIIHCRRDPMATCFSCYKMRFTPRELFFTNDLQDLGTYYRHYANLMSFWKSIFGDDIHEMVYEDLVADLETGVRRLLKFCGLSFESQCLKFHETKRNVRTASAAQVRRPIYADAVQAWKNYETELRPLQEALSGPAHQ